MLKVLVAFFLLGLISPAIAQQGTVSPEQLAHQIDDAVFGMAQQIRSLEATIKRDDEEVLRLKARIDDLRSRHPEEEEKH